MRASAPIWRRSPSRRRPSPISAPRRTRRATPWCSRSPPSGRAWASPSRWKACWSGTELCPLPLQSAGEGKKRAPLRNLVDRHLVGDAAQGRAAELGGEAAGLEQGRGFGILDHLLGHQDRARGRERLHPRGDVDGLAEIILAVVERDGEAGSLM